MMSGIEGVGIPSVANDTERRRVLVVGHTVSCLAVTPPYDGGKIAFQTASVGVESIAECIEAQVAATRKSDSTKVDLPPRHSIGGDPATGRKLRCWQLGWFKRGTTQRDAKTTLRISSIVDIRNDEKASYDGASGHNSDMFRGIGAFLHSATDTQPGWKSFVYAFIDAEIGVPEVGQIMPSRGAEVLLLHLTASGLIGPECIKDVFERIGALCRLARFVVVIMGDHALNHLGFPISDDGSLEGFAESLESIPENFAEKCKLSTPIGGVTAPEKIQFIVRQKLFGVVRQSLSYGSDGKPQRKSTWLHYLLDDDSLNVGFDGFIRGQNSLLGATIAAQWLLGRAHDNDDWIVEGIRQGMRRCVAFEKSGFYDLSNGPDVVLRRLGKILEDEDVQYFWVANEHEAKTHDRDGRRSVFDVLVWSLGHAERYSRKERVELFGSTQRSVTYAIGWDVIQRGLKKASETVRFPVVRFGDMVVTDRTAFEQLRDIQEAIRNYLMAVGLQSNPLSLGVFGAPGGGKSRGVKQLAASLNSSMLESVPLEVNLSQLRDAAELAWVFRRVRDINLQNKVPLVFFDEFDSPREGPFSWLKTFLAPMQDGRFGEGRDAIEFRHGIFVFIGGVSHSFAMFSGRSRDRDFIGAKGPDFISRLSRYLDVLGISSSSDDDYAWILRRAVVIRDLLYRYHKGVFVGGRDGTARIEEEVAFLLLQGAILRHGVRSLEAVIRTSRLSRDQPVFHRGCLPPEWQLDMHLDVVYFRHACKRWETLRDMGRRPADIG